jgi:two-component system, LytTR family, response regulator
MKIRTLLVDDEPLARQRLREMLAEHDDIEVMAECSNGQQAQTVLTDLCPDLLLLDVQMPRINGLKLVELLGDTALPLVVFVTAHDSFAIDAFDTRAVDYLLKPVRAERLHRALDRVREQITALREPAATRATAEPGNEPRSISRLMVRTGNRVVFIRSEQIDCIESAGNYVVVHAGDERHIVRETMTSLEGGLDPAEFVRLNRSLIVSISRIVELQSNGQGGYQAVLRGGRRVNVTVGLRDLEQRLRFG